MQFGSVEQHGIYLQHARSFARTFLSLSLTLRAARLDISKVEN